MALAGELSGLQGDLADVLACLADCVRDISGILRTASAGECGSKNEFGDNQLQVDMEADNLIFERLRACPAVGVASSEEQPSLVRLPGSGYGVAFDPLDGSSILGANFAVGSIFGVWPGDSMLGRPGRQQCAAAYAVYGPQTLLVLARPRTGTASAAAGAAGSSVDAQDSCAAAAAGPTASTAAAASSPVLPPPPPPPLSSTHIVQEFLLLPSGDWRLNRPDVQCLDCPAAAPKASGLGGPGGVFAPANLKAAAENREYAALVDAWVAARFTLRYTGGMVPDIHHMLAKSGGVFCNPVSASAPPKLRLLYECAPLAFVIEAAGGASHDGRGSVLEQVVGACSDRSIVCLGSLALVQQTLPALRAGLLPAPPS